MKLICIGRNYSEHIKELENEKPTDPVIFLKPDTAILVKKQPFFIPDFSNDVHHEVEILVKINKVGKYIDKKFAHKYYNEIGLGIDFTARDLQNTLKENGLPWEKAKSFDAFSQSRHFAVHILHGGQEELSSICATRNADKFANETWRSGIEGVPILNDYIGYTGVATLSSEGYSSLLHGSVVDMLYFPILQGHFPDWFPFIGGNAFEFFSPIFNIADASISVGVITLFLFQQKLIRKESQEVPATGTTNSDTSDQTQIL